MPHPYVRLEHEAPNPCPACGQRFKTAHWRQKFCSVPCKVEAMRRRRAKTCVKCKIEKPWDQFPLEVRSGVRPESCAACYAPRQMKDHKPPPLTHSLRPCEQCGKHYRRNKPPSAMKTRRFCSHACAYEAQRVQKKTCQTCARLLPYDAFALEPSAKGRRKTCESCESERARLREQKLGFMQSIGRMKLQCVTAASRSNLPYTITDDELGVLYKSPCVLCGQPSCCLRRIFPELGWLSGNVEGTCWLCSQMGTTKSGLLTDETILKHARAIVAYADDRA